MEAYVNQITILSYTTKVTGLVLQNLVSGKRFCWKSTEVLLEGKRLASLCNGIFCTRVVPSLWRETLSKIHEGSIGVE